MPVSPGSPAPRRPRPRLLPRIAVLACAALGLSLAGAVAPAAAADPAYDVLVFSKTAGFRHSSIASGITAIQELGAANNFTVTATEDATAFTTTNLDQYEAVVFLMTTGDVLDASQQSAFESYIRDGGGFAGVHAASDTEYSWPWYGNLVGAYFSSHPSIQQATIDVENRDHPSTEHLGDTWVRTDEWYNYNRNPRSSVNVLATLDESTYSGGDMGSDHPIAWFHEYDGGRSWYTGGGHTEASYSEPAFRTHLLGGIRYAAGVAGTSEGTFQQVTLAKGVPEVGEPMSIAVLPDRSVLHTSRDGKVRLTDAAGNTSLAATIPVYTNDEEGLQGVGIDPGFATNRFVYLYYAPVLAEGAPGVNRLSRFVLSANGTLDLTSEVAVLDVAATRGICCHVGGDIDFDKDGNLFLSTGDDTNPFSSDGSSPLDERSGREAYDAQRTSANTNDLRGKLLRIKVNANGTYSIPSGNLFAAGTAKTRPEIYAMGFRNPFRMSVDKPSGIVYLGDYGPDGGSADRGPSGQVEFNRVTGPGNYGWPYCTGDNEAYKDYPFPDGPIGATFDCAGGPTNNSPNNTGLTTLPAAKPAWITYGGNSSPPEFGSGSESPMGGPVYRYDPDNTSDVKFPASYHGRFFAGEFGRQWIKTVAVNADGTRGRIESFPWSGTQVMDMAFGPDGALYVLDYGDGGYFTGNEKSALYRIEYVTGNRAPTAVASATPTSGATPLSVQFTGNTSSDPDGDALTYAWDFDGNGTTDSTTANPSHTYSTAGTFSAKLTVTDPGGKSGSANVSISAGNTAPTVTFTSPANGQVFGFGDTVSYSVSVTDPEDGTIDCSDVSVTYGVGHDAHGHAETTKTGCSGTITTSADGEHDADANIFGSWSATYTDSGGLTSTASVTTQPKTRQAEHYSTMSGIQQVAKTGARGGKTVGYAENGDWVRFTPYNLTGVTSFSARVSSGTSGGTLELRAGSPTGTLAGSATVAGTGGWETFTDVTGTITDPGGTADLYLVFKGGSGYLFDVDEFTFVKSAPTTSNDLTPGSTATASSTENATHPASNAIDGNTSTRWSSQFSDPQSITIDLGEANTVTGVKLNWEQAAGKSYSIETSADGTSWRAASFSTTTGDGGVDDITFATAAADTRYVRMTGTTRTTPYGYSLWEFQVFGSASVTTTVQAEDAARSGGAAVSSEHAGYTGSGFVATYGSTGSTTAFTVNAASAGSRAVTVRYANGGWPTVGAKTLSLYVNGGKVKQVSLAATANWSTWAENTETVNLTAGNNTVSYKIDSGDSGFVNLDRITVTG